VTGKCAARLKGCKQPRSLVVARELCVLGHYTDHILILRRAGVAVNQEIALFPLWEAETIVAPYWSLGLSLLRFHIEILDLVNPMTIQTNSLTEPLNICPSDPYEKQSAEPQTRQKLADAMIPRDYVAMEDAVRQAKLVALEEETEAIHFANVLYWDRKLHSHEADMEHQRRQKRLKQVRKEFRRPESLKQEWVRNTYRL